MFARHVQQDTISVELSVLPVLILAQLVQAQPPAALVWVNTKRWAPVAVLFIAPHAHLPQYVRRATLHSR